MSFSSFIEILLFKAKFPLGSNANVYRNPDLRLRASNFLPSVKLAITIKSTFPRDTDESKPFMKLFHLDNLILHELHPVESTYDTIVISLS